ncbi:MAG: type II CAAX endopeptidase family protein [Solirubrobacterales bacterium]
MEASPAPKRRNSLTAYVGLPTIGWGSPIVALGAITAIVITVMGSISVVIFDPKLETSAGKDIAQLMVAVGLSGAALIFALADSGGRMREALARLGLRRLAVRAIAMAAMAWLAYFLIAALVAPLLQPEQQDVTRELGAGDRSALNMIAAGFLIVVAAPVSEELFFRGFMFAGLRRSLPIWPAAAISALIWGSLHLTGGNIGVAVQLAIFGVILAWLYERSGTLWAPICAHGINNTIAFILLLTGVV